MSQLHRTPRQPKIAETKRLSNIITEKFRYGRRRRDGEVSGTDEQQVTISTYLKKAFS